MNNAENQVKTGKKATQKPKGTQFAFLLYPENLPQNWEDELEALGLRCAISPLHDRDINKDGTPKKAHYHGIIVARNPITTQAMRNKLTNVLGKSVASQVQFIKKSIPDAYAYFTHSTKQAKADKKFQYDEKEIKLMNGFNVQRYETGLDEYDKKVLVNEICDTIMYCEVTNMAQLDKLYLASYEHDNSSTTVEDMREAVSGRIGLIRLYFDGVYQEDKKEQAMQQANANAMANSMAANVVADVFRAIRDGKKPQFPSWVADLVDQQDRDTTVPTVDPDDDVMY